jgi:hypothetical protein
MSTDKEREAFEVAMRERYGVANFARSQDGYVSVAIHPALRATYADLQMLWEVWQDRAALEAQPAKREPLTEEQILRCIQSIGLGDILRLTYDSGPYEVTKPTHEAVNLARAIERAHGISTDPTQAAPQEAKAGDVVVTWNESRTRILAVTRQDEALMRKTLEALERGHRQIIATLRTRFGIKE